MANCRYISTSFWTDTKVVDDFTPEDRYVYLYCMTNPHTTLCGCYEISVKQIATETGYNAETVLKIIRRLDEVQQVLRYSSATKELLLLNWHKYNWNGSNKLDRPLLESIRNVKCSSFRGYLANVYNARTSVTDPYVYEADDAEPCEPPPDDVEDIPDLPPTTPAKEKKPRHKYGTYGWVRLTDEEYSRLLNDLGREELERCIAYLDESAQGNGNKNKWKDWNIVIRKCSRMKWGANQTQTQRVERPSASQTAMNDLQMLHQQYSEEGY